MNFNFTLQCDTCGSKTNVRFGMSNRDEQPVRFACKSCGAPIDIIKGGRQQGTTGAKQIETSAVFDAATNFVDLHLDFPVSFAPYEMGMTPFMRAAKRISLAHMQLHQGRLDHLNQHAGKTRQFQTMLKMYARQKLLPFKLNLKRVFNIDVASDRPEDVEAALYNLIAFMMFPYEYPQQGSDAVQLLLRTIDAIAKQSKPALDAFITELVDKGFLKNLHLDVLEIYPRMLNAELALRPTLLLDFDAEYARAPIPMRVSAKDFEDFKDLYKDISEIISRQFVLIGGCNNLLKRGNHNSFAPRLTKAGKNLAPPNLNAYADVVFGLKQDDLDNSWYQLLDDSTSNHLRNAIAHYKAEYDDVTQLITYFPKREGLEQEHSEEIYFLEFMRRILAAYREMRRLHHLVKALNYYCHLIMAKAKSPAE